MVNVTVRLDENEKKAIQDYAEENGYTMSQAIRRAVKEFLAKQDKKEE